MSAKTLHGGDMKIVPLEITIGQLLSGFQTDPSTGQVVAYGGLLDVRPAYQREFVYNEKQQQAVIETVLQGFPLNVMYWAKVDGSDRYEVLDGQQRTISLANFAAVATGFYVHDPLDGKKKKSFHSLSKERQQRFKDYPLTVYVCEGDHDKKLAWFQTINIAGEVLTAQELRNAVYSGPWVAEAKKLFSGTNPPMAAKAKGLIPSKVKPVRQDLLELAIKWICNGKKADEVEKYMLDNQHKTNANELKLHFMRVVDWANTLFPPEDDAMKLREKVDWGALYRAHSATSIHLDPKVLKEEIDRLLMDEDVQVKHGVYCYVLDHDETWLNLRGFPEKIKQEQYKHQAGVCPHCSHTFTYQEMDGDHIVPWSKGGKTDAANCQMLCKTCNANKSNKGNGPRPAVVP